MSPLPVIFVLLVASLSLAIEHTLAAAGQQRSGSKQDLNEASNKKCVPLFDRHTLTSVGQQQQPAGFGIRHANNASFSFQVGDIDLPLMQAEGSIHSAMRLLSTFSSQFDHLMPGDDDRDDEQHADEDEDDGDDRLRNVVKFRENKLHLSGLNLSMLNVHLYSSLSSGDGNTDPKFGIGITIKNATLDGKFTYKGPLAPLTSAGSSNSLKGYYSMSIDNIYLLVTSNLTKVPLTSNDGGEPVASGATKTISAYQQQQRFKTNEFKLNVTNLGYINIDIYDSKSNSTTPTTVRQPTSNYLLKMLQKVLQRTIKRTYLTFEHHITKALELEGRRVLDCELTRFDDLLRVNVSTLTNLTGASGPTQASVDRQGGDLARVLDREIVHSGLSRVDLPDFEHQQSVFGSVARISFFNGSLSGLNTIKMIGETRIKLQDQHLIMNTSLGWLELRPYYSWNLTLGAGGGNHSTAATPRAPVSHGFVSFTIKDFDFDAVITKGLAEPLLLQQQQQQPSPHEMRRILVEQLVIRHLDSPKMDIGGLPGMNRLTRAMVNFFMGRLKQRLTGAIQPVLKHQLERSLNKLLLP